MADPKQLRFQFVVDEASLQKTRQLIRELTSDLAKLNEASGKMGSMFGGGGGAGGGAGLNVSAGGARSPEQQRVISKTAPIGRQLVQGFLDQKQVFKGIADGSKDALQKTDQVLKKSVSSQKQELEGLERTVKKLSQAYNELQRTARFLEANRGQGASDKLINAHRAEMDRFKSEMLDPMDVRRRNARLRYDTTDPARVAELQKIYGETGPYYGIKEMEREIAEEKRAARGPSAGLFGARQMPAWAGQAMKLGGMVLAGGLLAQQESMAGITGYAGMEARRANIVGGQMGRLLGGDVKLMYAMKTMDSNMRQDVRDINSSTTGKIDTYLEMGKNAAKSIPGVGAVLGGGSGANGGIGGAFTDAEKGSYQAEKAIRLAEAHSQSLILENFAMDKFQADLGARVSAGRTLGLGRSIDPKTRQYVDTYGRMENKLSARGYSVAEKQAAKLQLQSMAGEKFGFQFMDAAMRANAQGLSGYAGLLAAQARAGLSGDDLARGFIGGGIDANAGILLGQTLLGTGFDPRGTTTGAGALLAAQAGFGWSGGPMDFNLAQRVGLGMNLGQTLTTGALDPYQRSRNLVSAINANPGMDIYGQDFLANGMSMKQMVDMGTGNSPLTATAWATGQTPEGIKKQLGSSVTSMIDRYRDTGGNNPMARYIRDFRKFKATGGGDLSDYFDSLTALGGDAKMDAVRALGAFYGIQSGQGEEAGLGLMGLEAGLSNAQIGVLKKGQVGRGMGQTEKDSLEGTSKAAEKVTDAFEKMGQTLNDTFKNIPADFMAMKGFNDRLDANATKFIDSLMKLTTAINNTTKAIGVKGAPR